MGLLIKFLFILTMALALPVRAEPTILVVGDSISAGFGIPVQQGWVALLEHSLQQDVPDLKMVNASISGETTGGGANPGGVFAINNDFRMFIATGKAVNPITKTNWEGTGVKPEVETTAEDALEKAKALAAETIEKNWQRTIATRTMALDEFFDIVNQLNKEQKSHDKLVKQYQSKLTSNIKTLGLGRRELSQLVNLNFESNPQTAAVFIQIAINQSPKEVRLYQALADALVNAEQVEAAKNAVRQGIANAANDDDKQQLHDKLAAIGTEQTSL